MSIRHSRRRPHRAPRLATLGLRALEDRCVPANLVVTSAADSGGGSLRAVIATANSNSVADTITFDPSIFATPQTIKLTTGEIALSAAVSVIGPGAALTISGNSASRIFNTYGSGYNTPYSFSNLILTGGKTTNYGGAILSFNEQITLDHCQLSGNVSTTTGGGAIGIIGGGALIASDCVLSGNSAAGMGGAVDMIGSNSKLTMQRCTVSDNIGASGGGLAVTQVGATANSLIVDSTISGNIAKGTNLQPIGGGVYFYGNIPPGALTFRDTTISGNQSGSGGGIYLRGPSFFPFTAALTVQNSTVAANIATQGTGGGIALGASSGGIALESSIVGKNSNSTAPDVSTGLPVQCANTIISSAAGFNFVDLGGNQIGVDPLIGRLADYGGPTKTHPLLAGSPAIDAGSNSTGLTYDQRGPGFPRVIGGAPDVGAVEGISTIPAALAISPAVNASGGTIQTITVTYYDDAAIDVSSLDTGDISVTGPYGFSAIPTFVSVDANTNGSPRVATYTFTPPSGSWDYADYGDYTISMNANAVFDTDGPAPHAIPPGMIGDCSATIGINYLVDLAVDENDANTSAGDLSLREAVKLANKSKGPDVIGFSPTVFPSPRTLTLTSGEIAITDSVTILSPIGRLTISGNKSSRILNTFTSGVSDLVINIAGLSFINGVSSPILNYQKLTLDNVQISGCAGANGGAIHNYQDLTLTNVQISGCNATKGGAVYNDANASVTLEECAISGNQGSGLYFEVNSSGTLEDCSISSNQGGGIYVNKANSVTVLNSTISVNSATSYGGGVYFLNPSAVLIRNSTINGNSSTVEGGGIAVVGTATNFSISNCTVAGNSSKYYGGGVFASNNIGMLNFANCIIAGNTTTSGIAPDLSLGSMKADYCVLGVADSGIGQLTGNGIKDGTLAAPLNPLLEPLADNGGPTKTQLPRPGSPALGGGLNTDGLAFDQRGYPRPIQGAIDVGAVEGVSSIPTALALPQNINAPTSGTQAATVTFFDDLAIDVTTLGTGDIKITGPYGFSVAPTFVSVDVNANGTPRVATYAFTPPGGSWDQADNGDYTITINANQVLDTDSPTPHSIAAQIIGSIHVAIPASYVVDLATDEDDGNYAAGDLSLREAIKLANANHPANAIDTITFSPAVFGTVSIMKLTLGEFVISDAVIINGPAARLTIDAGNKSRVFNINSPFSYAQAIRISNLTLINAKGVTGDGGAILDYDEALTLSGCTISSCSASSGGGICLSSAVASLNLTDCVLNSNSAGLQGGAMFSNYGSTISLTHCAITNNSTGRIGGGILMENTGGNLIVTDTTITGNKAPMMASTSAYYMGGGIFLAGQSATFRNCTLSGNSADRGGAIMARGDTTITIQNCTISQNMAMTVGGGISFDGDTGALTITDSTVSGNQATTSTVSYSTGGGGVYLRVFAATIRNTTISGNSAVQGGGIQVRNNTALTLQNSTVAFNTATTSGGGINRIEVAKVSLTSSIVGKNTGPTGPDMSGSVNASFSLFGNTTGATITGANNLLNVDPMLAPLANNGGPTYTHALLPVSPCVNAGSNPASLNYDQRGTGFARQAGSATDIGAYELQSPGVMSIVLNDGSAQRSRVTGITVNFDSLVTLPSAPANAFQLKRQNDNMLVGLTAIVTNSNTTSVMLQFNGTLSDFGSLQDGRYTLTVFADQVSNFVSVLDGNADGTPGDDYVLVGSPANGLFRLFGDSDGNGVIDGVDYGAFRAAFNTNNSIFSFDGTGPVDGVDFGQFRQRFGVMI